MASFISIDMVGEERVFNLLAELPAEVQNTALDDVNKYILDTMQSSQPSPRYVTRRAAYGVTFFSDRQRRWFFANLNDGSIDVPYRRTQGLRKNWRIKGSGQNAAVINDTPGIEFVMGDQQSRHEALVGWRKPEDIIREREERIQRIIEGSVTKAIKRLGG